MAFQLVVITQGRPTPTVSGNASNQPEKFGHCGVRERRAMRHRLNRDEECARLRAEQ